MKRYRFFLLVCGFIFLVFIGDVHAQEKYPNRPIELVVPFSPGGSGDIPARIYAQKLSENLKVPVVVVNRTAGGGIQGTNYVARAKKDGYTLLAMTSAVWYEPIVTKEATWDASKDFFPLGCLGYIPHVYTVQFNSPFKSLAELVEYARRNPGKLKASYGGGRGAPGYLNFQLLLAKNNIKIPVIPYLGGADATLALLGGHVDMTFSGTLSQGPQIKAGKFRALAITSKKRDPHFPDVPTTAELGYPYMNLRLLSVAFAQGGTPQSVLKVLIPAFEKTFKDPEVIARATAAYLVVDYMGPEELRKLIVSEGDIVRKVVKETNITQD